jgi:triacylglycerol esterase/lipase EstA (alpha/beta hydrolase family)
MVEKKIILIAAIVILLAAGIGAYTLSTSSYNRPADTASAANKTLPVLLVHGLAEDGSVWKKWEELLKQDGLQFYTVTFQKSDDKCGAAVGHATELGERTQTIKNETGSSKVNIVGHSKGGLDARVYLANGTKDVANLIMIGTPNAGSPLAQKTSACAPAVWDTIPGAKATKAKFNSNTKYYTIAGDWQHNLQGNPMIPGPDDGLTPLSSAQPGGNFTSLGTTLHQHMELLGQDEYNLARGILIENK